MSQQGERPTAAEDDWWSRLYDETAEDQGAAATGESLDDRFDSVAGTVSGSREPLPEPLLGPGPLREPEPLIESEPKMEPEPEPDPKPETEPEPYDEPVFARDPAPAPAPVSEPEDAREDAPVSEPEGTRWPGAEPRAGVPWEPPTRDPWEPTTRDPWEPPARAPWEPPADDALPSRTFPFRPGPHRPPDTVLPPPAPSPTPPPPASPSVPSPPSPPPPPLETAPPAQLIYPATRFGAQQLGPPAAPPLSPRPLPAQPQLPAQEFNRSEPAPQPGAGPVPRPAVVHVGDGPPTYDAEPTALPGAHPDALAELTADTVLDGARYGSYTLRTMSVRGDSARYRGEPRRDALLTARFGSGDSALVLVAVAGGARPADGAHLAAADACRWIGGAVGRSRARLSEDIRADRRGDLKSGLHRLTGRGFGKLRARADELGLEPHEYTTSLRCLLLSGDPECRTRVFFGVGDGGLFRLRDGTWQDLEPLPPEYVTDPRAAVAGFPQALAETPEGDRLTMDLGRAAAGSPYASAERPVPPLTAEPFLFRASTARPGDTLLLCSAGLAEPLRGEPELAGELAERWASAEPPGLTEFLSDAQIRVKGYADDRTAAAVWEA
ncbi:protein phosphatase 2C domain-containing protein [Streptomyces sp. A 4/2]|uniref:protein phosphatase 2C domain-containing protein n=1 Tax=Streptomyces sp. A 4/2 TaxID=2934314 RepID=UPI002024CF5D|nr:protein phosphatase 2C domain-containing protein [Streptomyces sp. A 4/2]